MEDNEQEVDEILDKMGLAFEGHKIVDISDALELSFLDLAIMGKDVVLIDEEGEPAEYDFIDYVVDGLKSITEYIENRNFEEKH